MPRISAENPYPQCSTGHREPLKPGSLASQLHQVIFGNAYRNVQWSGPTDAHPEGVYYSGNNHCGSMDCQAAIEHLRDLEEVVDPKISEAWINRVDENGVTHTLKGAPGKVADVAERLFAQQRETNPQPAED